MSGFLTLLIAVLSILTLGLLLFLMNQQTYAKNPDTIGPELADMRSEKLKDLAESAGGGEEDCKEDAAASEPGLKVQTPEAVKSELVKGHETAKVRDSEDLKSLEFPDIASLKISGTGEFCRE